MDSFSLELKYLYTFKNRTFFSKSYHIREIDNIEHAENKPKGELNPFLRNKAKGIYTKSSVNMIL